MPAILQAACNGATPPQSDSVHPLLEAATKAWQQGDLATCCKCLQAASSRNPTRPDELLAIGYLRLNIHDLDSALAAFTKAAALDSTFALAHASRALSLQLLERTEEAEDAARTALEHDGKQLVALKVLARICISAGQASTAKEYCQRILAVQPNDADAQAILVELAGASTTRNAESPVLRRSTERVSAMTPPASPAVRRSPSRPVPPQPVSPVAPAVRPAALSTEHLLQKLIVGDFARSVELVSVPASHQKAADGFAIPPVDLTMGYGAGDLNHYLACGRRSYDVLTQLLAQQNVTLGNGDAVLDWGCAAGRVVRNFGAEAQRGCQIWGGDVHEPSIRWAQQHLAPPFRFFNSTAFPHLPFADGTFRFIYGFSVMTHLNVLRDMWLLELRRVLRPDGLLLLTIHDEHTWGWFRERGMPGWMPGELRSHPALPSECVEIRGDSWEKCYTFFSGEYIRRVWGQFFARTEVIPQIDGYQAGVVLRKI